MAVLVFAALFSFAWAVAVLKDPTTPCAWQDCFDPPVDDFEYDISNLNDGVKIYGISGFLKKVIVGEYATLSADGPTNFRYEHKGGTPSTKLVLESSVQKPSDGIFIFEIDDLNVESLTIQTKVKLSTLSANNLNIDISTFVNTLTSPFLTCFGNCVISWLKLYNLIAVPPMEFLSPVLAVESEGSYEISGWMDDFTDPSDFGKLNSALYFLVENIKTSYIQRNEPAIYTNFFIVKEDNFYLNQTCGNGRWDEGEDCDERGDLSCTYSCKCASGYNSTMGMKCSPWCDSNGCAYCLIPGSCGSCKPGYKKDLCDECDNRYKSDGLKPPTCTPICTSPYCDGCIEPDVCDSCKEPGKQDSYPAIPLQGCLECKSNYSKVDGSQYGYECKPICTSPLCQNCKFPDKCESCEEEGYDSDTGCLSCSKGYFINEETNKCRMACNEYFGCLHCSVNGCLQMCKPGYTGEQSGCFDCDLDNYDSQTKLNGSVECLPRCLLNGAKNPFCDECIAPQVCSSCNSGTDLPDCMPNCTYLGNGCNTCIGKEKCEFCDPAFVDEDYGCNRCDPINSLPDYKFPDCRRKCGDYCAICKDEKNTSEEGCNVCMYSGLRADRNCKYCNGTGYVGRAPNCYPRNGAVKLAALNVLVIIAFTLSLFLL